MKFVIIGLIMLMYSIITTFNWVKIGKPIFDKYSTSKTFSWNKFGFFIASDLIATTVFTTIAYNLSTGL